MSRNDQTATLRLLSQGSVVSLDPPHTRAVAVTGGKGGVGKSTVALNLSVAYARRGARTLMLDSDLGLADLNLLLGLAPSRSLLDVLQGHPIREVLVEAHGITLLPALNGSYTLANIDERARQRLFDAIESLGDDFDTLVVDTAAGISENAVAFAGAAGEIVVCTTPEPLALADAYACVKALATRHGVQRAFLLPNAVRSPSEADDVVGRLSALVDRFLGVALTPLPPIPFDPMVAVAAAAGVPLLLHSPDSPASRAVLRVARRIDSLAQHDDEEDGQRVRLWLRRVLRSQIKGAMP